MRNVDRWVKYGHAEKLRSGVYLFEKKFISSTFADYVNTSRIFYGEELKNALEVVNHGREG